MRVLLWNRSNAFDVPGGDTVIMRRLIEELPKFGVELAVYDESQSPDDFDLVHLINLTVKNVSEEVQRKCNRAGVPFVITTLCEDWPRYLLQSVSTVNLFQRYLSNGRDETTFRRDLQSLMTQSPAQRVGLTEVVNSAALLFSCGPSESDRLAVDYPRAAHKTVVAKFGVSEVQKPSAEEIAFVRGRLGFDEFALCVGRLETRKNQLMLMKALENEGLPIVLAAGKASVQAPYVNLISQFTLKSPVRIVRHLEQREYSAMLSAASVHVLPSWFELPGLVSLEAAAHGTPVVASDWGALTDYLPEGQFSACDPSSPESIQNAVRRALHTPRDSAVAKLASSYTWQQFASSTLSGYERALSRGREAGFSYQTATFQSLTQPTESPVPTDLNSNFKYDASIIIPCYNRADLTKECLEAVCNTTDTVNFEVILINNASTDGTAELLNAIEGDVKVIHNKLNKSFAESCNQGALNAEGRYLVFLNNDTVPQQGWLSAMLECASQTNAEVVGCKLLYPDGTTQHAGVAINRDKTPYHVFQKFPGDHRAVNDTRVMTAVSAACMLVQHDAFRKVGGFDPAYINGFEDIDLCIRIAQSGGKVMYTPDAVVLHHEESTPGRKTHDTANLNLFLGRYRANLASDEDALLARYGLQIEWNNTGGRYSTNSAANEPQRENTKTMDQQLETAKKLYAETKFSEAASILQNIVESKVTLAGEGGFETWQTLGNCLARLSRSVEAENAFYQAMQYDSNSERPFLGLGTVAMLEENWLAAQYSFMIALAKNPSTLRGEFGVGVSLAARNRHAEAIRRFQKVVEKEPGNSEALFYLYRSAMELGEPQLAIPYLQRFVSTNPTDVNFLFHLCGAYWKTGELTKAVDACQRVLDLDPTHEAANEVLNHLERSLAVNV